VNPCGTTANGSNGKCRTTVPPRRRRARLLAVPVAEAYEGLRPLADLPSERARVTEKHRKWSSPQGTMGNGCWETLSNSKLVQGPLSL
jgi:hypothetical protein